MDPLTKEHRNVHKVTKGIGPNAANEEKENFLP